jgi:hypothetical protein
MAAGLIWRALPRSKKSTPADLRAGTGPRWHIERGPSSQADPVIAADAVALEDPFASSTST